MVDSVERIPPHSQEAEVAVLGSMLLDREAVGRAVAALDRSHFYRDAHAVIFETAKSLYLRDIPVDFVTLTDELRRQGMLERVGGSTYITSLVDMVSTSANVDHYIEVVAQKALLRRIIKAGTGMIEASYGDREPADRVLAAAAEEIFRLSRERDRGGFVPIAKATDQALDYVQRLHRKKELADVVPTGYHKLDDKLAGGLHKSNFIIIAGRPGMGKTSLAMNIAANAALRHRVTVAVFSLEMSATDITMRLLCSESGVDSHRVRKGFLQKDDWARLTTAAGRIKEASLFIDDCADLNIVELRTRARNLAFELRNRDRQLGLVVIDYIQRMRGTSGKESRQQEIAEISNGIKSLARELDIPVIGLSQLSRKPEDKDRDKRPKLSDLRESGALEQDADVVMFIFSEDWKTAGGYGGGGTPLPADAEGPGDAPAVGPRTMVPVKVAIAKHRNGPTGVLGMVFEKPTTTFRETGEWDDGL